MSFTFQWPRFSDRFHAEARDMLHTALNKGNKPPIIADKIEVVELEMGTQPPELEIKDIGELTKDQFRGIFKLTYSGDAFIVLRTKVQANPLTNRSNGVTDILGGSGGILAAHQPLVVPMLLRLSQFRLNSYVVLVVSKQKGCTLVFKTDPLQNVEVSSTFDSIAVIQSFIQKEIEEQLREMFREDLPGIIHRLSQQWVAGNTRVEAPYLKAPPHHPYTPTSPSPLVKAHGTRSQRSAKSRHKGSTAPSRSDDGRLRNLAPLSALPVPGVGVGIGVGPGIGLHHSYSFGTTGRSPVPSHASFPISSHPPSSLHSSIHPSGPGSKSPNSFNARRPPIPWSQKSGIKTPVSSDFPQNPNSSQPDIENFDPTYGLRPDLLPTRTDYSGFGKLFGTSRGLHELAEEQEQQRRLRREQTQQISSEMDGESTYDVVEWDDSASNFPLGHNNVDDVDDLDEINDTDEAEPNSGVPSEESLDLETIPAVGGGFITRPRMHHSHSSIKSPRIPETDPLDPQGIFGNLGTLDSLGVPDETVPGDRRRDLRANFSLAGSARGISGPDVVPASSRAHSISKGNRRPKEQGRGKGKGRVSSPPAPSAYNPYFGDAYLHNSRPNDDDQRSDRRSNLTRSPSSRPRPIGIPLPSSPGRNSEHTRSMSQSPPMDPFQYGSPPKHRRRGSGLSDDPDNFDDMGFARDRSYGRNTRGIILRNQSVTHLSALSRSNQTLSPYTMSFSHYTVRSGPPKPLISSTTPSTRLVSTFASNNAAPKKAKRKRIFHLGQNKSKDNDQDKKQSSQRQAGQRARAGSGSMYGRDRDPRLSGRPSLSPAPPSEFSDDDVEHYFRTRRPSESVHQAVHQPPHPVSHQGAQLDREAVDASISHFKASTNVSDSSNIPSALDPLVYDRNAPSLRRRTRTARTGSLSHSSQGPGKGNR